MICKDKDKIYIGADLKASNNYGESLIVQDKLESTENYILSTSGYIFYKELAKSILSNIDFKSLNDHHALQKKLELIPMQLPHDVREFCGNFSEESSIKGNIELIFRGKIFKLDFYHTELKKSESYEVTDDFSAYGSGRHAALGIYFFLKHKNVPPKDIVKAILQEISNHDSKSGGGGTIYEHDLVTFENKLIEKWID